MIKQKHGFTILEAVASVFIITLVLTTAMTIVLNMRNQAMASEQKIKATDVGSLIRNDISSHYDYDTLNLWLDGNAQVLTYENCTSSPISCDVFLYASGDKSYENDTVITFLAPTFESTNYKIIHYEITMTYFKERTFTLEGAVYEKA